MDSATSAVNWVTKLFSWRIRNFPQICGIEPNTTAAASGTNTNPVPTGGDHEDGDGNPQVFKSILEFRELVSPIIHVKSKHGKGHTSQW